MLEKLRKEAIALKSRVEKGETAPRARFQFLEKLLDEWLHERVPACRARIPADSLTELLSRLPREANLKDMEQKLIKAVAHFSSLPGVALISRPHRKSDYAIYEKLIDDRVSRQGSERAAKVRRANNFVELVRSGEIVVSSADLVRSRLIMETPEDFLNMAAWLGAQLENVGLRLGQTRKFNVSEQGLPALIATSDYLAVHFKIPLPELPQFSAELQLRVADNHWGPHAFTTLNGYLNKYLAPSAEEVDYRLDQIKID